MIELFVVGISALAFIFGWFFGPCRFSNEELDKIDDLLNLAKAIQSGELKLHYKGEEIDIFDPNNPLNKYEAL